MSILLTLCCLLTEPEADHYERVVIIADSQIHQPRGSPRWTETFFIDAFIEVTIRPSQQVLFGPTMLGAIVEQNIRTPIVHLGDGLDISCTSEMEVFLEIMDQHPNWVMAPGNHDGYFIGNFFPTENPDWHLSQESWKLACQDRAFWGTNEGGQPLNKAQFVEQYIAHLLKLEQVESENHWETGDDSTFLGDVYWSIKPNPWESFVIQRVRLNSDRDDFMILFDTGVYQTRPAMRIRNRFPKAGVTGSISGIQFDLARTWIAEHPGNYVLAGHHPFSDLDETSKASLGKLLTQNSTVYISAHTHKGGWYTHNVGDDMVYELNIGSVLDSPIHFRDISLSPMGEKLDLVSHFIDPEFEFNCGTSPAPPKQHSCTARIWKTTHIQLNNQIKSLLDYWAHMPNDLTTTLTYAVESTDDGDVFLSIVGSHKISVEGHQLINSRTNARRKSRYALALTKLIEDRKSRMNQDEVQALQEYCICRMIQAAKADRPKRTAADNVKLESLAAFKHSLSAKTKDTY
ncbi:MAG: hypothetical protein KDC35_13280 [Acidobacteria bacterium]|nr:hypothetical protein [Acidobacteriota bacterium]